MFILSKSILSIFLGYVIAISLGFIIVPLFKKIGLVQNVSRSINLRHLVKDKTPTMGGLIFILPSVIILSFLFINKNVSFAINFIIVIISFILYAFLGFLDDFLKIKYHNNKGLSILKKFIIEILIALSIFIIFILMGNSTVISFLNFKIDLNYLYGIFILLLMISTTNAVNITDGLDGLCAGISLIAFLTYGIIAWKYNHIVGNELIAIFCFIMVGSLLGFLHFNFYPAKIFMGDLGSLALGGSIAAISIILKIELSLLIIGFVFVIETLSSLLQILSIKIFRKRLFKKSPLHHHFEEEGMVESDIIKLFYMISIICSLISLIYYT
ncbi:MAG: phospho-N-acetylmuramoyl-pentapeptide-transferase [Bacilli bacterium]|nr:phospho-N-acetylmuramoyl-pentapeptide-transferase [Bacilli bacterium]